MLETILLANLLFSTDEATNSCSTFYVMQYTITVGLHHPYLT